MDAEFYTHILLPFIRDKFPGGTHHFMQDNNPNTSQELQTISFEANEINWWKTPTESPDLNPIENLCMN